MENRRKKVSNYQFTEEEMWGATEASKGEGPSAGVEVKDCLPEEVTFKLRFEGKELSNVKRKMKQLNSGQFVSYSNRPSLP